MTSLNIPTGNKIVKPPWRYNSMYGFSFIVKDKPKVCEVPLCGFNIRVEGHHLLDRRLLEEADNQEYILFLCPNHHVMANLGLLNNEIEIIKGKEFVAKLETLKIKANNRVLELLDINRDIVKKAFKDKW